MAAWRATRAVTRGAGLCASLAPLVRPARLQAPLRSFNRFMHQKGALNQVRAGWLLPQSPLVAVALVGVGGYLGADEKRCDLLVEYGKAALRAFRLLTCCISIAYGYKQAKRLDSHGAYLSSEEEKHKELQIEAGRAERARRQAVMDGVDAAEAEAEAARTRHAAMRFGEELAAKRVALENSDNNNKTWHELHTRGAQKMLAMCLANGGIYVKLGQHIAQLDYIVPEPYTKALSALFRTNMTSPWEDVVKVIREDLGAEPEELFGSIERTPLASASLAQVHRATARDTGAPLAVKVQHPNLREICDADMAAVAVAVKLAGWLFPDDFTLQWLLEEMKVYLPRELDFESEARNVERCRRFFSCAGAGAALADAVVVPGVVHSLTTPRVLTMTFEEGCSVTDIDALRKMNISPSLVTKLLCETFCSQIFLGNFVHCDPHPGNVLIRQHPNCAAGTPQLVLLDHGLYSDLPEEFVTMYARLWHGLVLGDAESIRSYSEAMGVGEYYPLFAAMLTARPWADILGSGAEPERLRERGTAEDKAQIRGYAAQYAKGIAVVLQSVPRPMLLLFKTNDCLRHAERQLSSGVNSFLITLRFCIGSILKETRQERQKQHSGLSVLARLAEARLAFFGWLLDRLSESYWLPYLLSWL